MEVILAEDIQALGKAGQIVKVKEGYGRNYLLPYKKAYLADTKNVKALEIQKNRIAAQRAKVVKTAEDVVERLKAIKVTITAAVGEKDRLFGSVTKMDLVEELKKQGLTLDKHQIGLETPIKSIGEFEVPVKLHSEVQGIIQVQVVAQEG